MTQQIEWKIQNSWKFMEHMQYKSIIQVQIYLCFALIFAQYIKKTTSQWCYDIKYCYCKLNTTHTHTYFNN